MKELNTCDAYFSMMNLHVTECPNLRVGQLISNFTSWLKDKKSIDIYYLNDIKIVHLLEEYLESLEENKNACHFD